MSRTIDFQGGSFDFPDEATNEQILEFFNTMPEAKQATPEEAAADKIEETRIYHGDDAVAKVEALEGKLSPSQAHLVRLEGYVRGNYKDTKGVDTRGVGQTGAYANMPFKEVYEAHVTRAKSRIRGFDKFPDYVQQELVQAEYRGDLALSPTFRKLLNAGEYAKASEEFLDNDDYRNSLEAKDGIAKRMEMVATAVKRFADEQSDAEDAALAQAEADTKAKAKPKEELSPVKSGLFTDDNGNLFVVDEKGNKTEVK